MSELAGREVVRVRAVQLKTVLDLEGLSIWRRLIVPSRFSFSELHKVLQTVLGWQDYHFHAFEQNWPAISLNHTTPFITKLGNAAEYEELYERDLNVGFDHQLRLMDYLPQCKHFKYVYDYGDNWDIIWKWQRSSQLALKIIPSASIGKGRRRRRIYLLFS